MQIKIGNDTADVTLPATSTGTHVYGYDTSGNLTTDTWTIGGNVYVKTYGYTSGVLTSESDWVKQ